MSENSEKIRNDKIGDAWQRHLARTAETQKELEEAAEKHRVIFEPSLEQYQAEFSQAWDEYHGGEKSSENG